MDAANPITVETARIWIPDFT